MFPEGTKRRWLRVVRNGR